MPPIHSFYLSDIGRKRANNEDAVGAFEPRDARQLRQSGCLYVVADGLGGHEKGEQASRLVVDSLLKLYYQSPEIPPEKRLRDIIQQVHRQLIAARKNLAPGEKMATTVVAAVVRGNTLQVAHVGDSRAYLLREGKIHQLTQDHSFIGEMLRAGAITEQEAMQSRYRNRLTRSVGGQEGALKVDVTPPIPLRPGDRILLCTDGLTQYAASQDLTAMLSTGTPQQVVQRLIRFANERGGADNITACVVEFGKKSALALPLPSWKTAAALGAAALLLLIGVLFGRYGLPLLLPTATPTATASPTLTATFTLTPEATATLTAEPSATPTPASTETPAPTPGGTPPPTETGAPSPTVAAWVDCQYTVRQGDTAGQIVQAFGTDLAHLFRQDGSQDGFETIRAGEILILNDISPQTCLNGGGKELSPQTIP